MTDMEIISSTKVHDTTGVLDPEDNLGILTTIEISSSTSLYICISSKCTLSVLLLIVFVNVLDG